MMITSILIGAAALTGTPTVSWESPSRYVEGAAFNVSVEIQAAEDGSPIANWLLTPAAFTINDKPLGDRTGKGMIPVAAGTKINLSFDLATAISAVGGLDGKSFTLGYAGEVSDLAPVDVITCKLASEGLDFMKMPVGDLTNYQVILETNRGDMVLEFWPDAAPKHVRNYLDLCYTGFYDGLTFHRVMPGFMIQGGCPKGTGSGSGPRRVEAEFSTDEKYKHLPGVLSMARSTDPNSATSQFFVMHGTSPHLDGKYSAFGKLVEGFEVVDRIVTTPTGAATKPTTKQVIRSAIVIQLDPSTVQIDR